LKTLIAFVKILAFVALTFLVPAVSPAQEGFEAAEILFTRAVLAYDDGNYAEAARDLLRAHELDPGHIGVIYYLGLSYNAQGNFADAERYLREGLAREPKNSDLRYELGVSLYSQNKVDEALKEFLAIYQAEPHKDNLGYYIGLCYYQKENYETALGYFRKNVSGDIKIRQLNQYSLGLALRALGREAEAIEELTEAVKIAPAGPLVGATQQLLTTLREETGRKRLRIELTVNGQYDTNPGFARVPTRSGGNLFYGTANYTVYRSGPWESAVNYYLLQTVNYGPHKFDLNDNGIAANLAYKSLVAGFPSVAGVQLSNDFVLQGGDKYLQRPTATLTFTLQENASNSTTALFRAQYKDFISQGVGPDEDRRAANELLGFIHCWGYCNTVRFALGQFLINFGYNWDHDDANGRNWRYTGHKAIGGFSVGLPWELQFVTNVEFHARFYPGANTVFGGHRRDFETTALAVISKDLTQNLTVALQHFWDRDFSTISDFRTYRQVVALGLTWRY
jgi:tetratricopeptide (TPR) repeat protein